MWVCFSQLEHMVYGMYSMFLTFFGAFWVNQTQTYLSNKEKKCYSEFCKHN